MEYEDIIVTSDSKRRINIFKMLMEISICNLPDYDYNDDMMITFNIILSFSYL